MPFAGTGNPKTKNKALKMPQEIKPNIFFTGAIHPDRKLFDEFMKLPDGTSYNSFFIKGSEKNALIDTVDPSKENPFFENLKQLGITKIDFIVSNHAEQDHSGCIPKTLEMFPNAKVVCNARCKEMLMHELLIPEEKFFVITDRQTISLGDKTLEFIFAPWVHWPETMFTYCREDKILFTGDLFGSHIAFSELLSKNDEFVKSEAKRYFAGIMMPFRSFIRKHLETISKLQIEIIAPTHGPIYTNPGFIIELHKDWASEESKNIAVIALVSMHHSTEAMVHHFEESLKQKGVEVKTFNIVEDLDKAVMKLTDAKTLVLATPTFFAGPHPSMVHAAYLINCLKPKAKYLAMIGSEEWGGKMTDQLTAFFTFYKPEMLGKVTTKGFPKEDTLVQLEKLAEQIAEKHKKI